MQLPKDTERYKGSAGGCRAAQCSVCIAQEGHGAISNRPTSRKFRRTLTLTVHRSISVTYSAVNTPLGHLSAFVLLSYSIFVMHAMSYILASSATELP